MLNHLRDSIIENLNLSLKYNNKFAVNAIKINQNFWRPGIILAGRVMEMGDNGHISIAAVLVEKLIPLRGGYKRLSNLSVLMILNMGTK